VRAACVNILVFAFISLLFINCTKEEAAITSFSFKSPVVDEQIWNTSSISFNVPTSFNGAIEVSIDGNSIGVIENSPYSLELNTQNYQDGLHTLSAKTISSAGDLQEINERVEIKNTMLVINIDNEIPSDISVFIFINDANGKLVLQQELKNNSHVEIRNPIDFNDRKFFVSEAHVAPPGYLQIYSFSEMTRGRWKITPNVNTPNILGSIEVKSETPPPSVFFVSSSGGDYDFIDSYTPNVVLSTNKTPSRLFIRDVDQVENKYTLINDVNVGAKYNFPLESVNGVLKAETITLDDASIVSSRVRLYGFPTSESYNEYYPLGVFFRSNKKLKIEYPENEFQLIGSESYFRDNQIRLYSFKPNKLYDFKPLKAEINVSTDDNKVIDLSTFGEFDIYLTTWMYFNEKLDAYASWQMIGPSGRNQKLELPVLPREIVTSVSNIKFDQLLYAGVVQLSDYEGINNYSEYLNFVSIHGLAGPYQFGRAWKEELFTQSGFTSGRVQHVEVPMLAEQLKIVE
jgi:hypothetical protein